MADKPFHCRLITPQARVFDGSVSYASVPLWDGKMGFMAGTGAIVGRLGAGELRIEFIDRYEAGVKVEESGRKQWFVESGFVQNVNNELTILATKAEEIEALDAAQAQKELDEAVGKSSKIATEMDRITEDRNRARAKLALARAK